MLDAEDCDFKSWLAIVTAWSIMFRQGASWGWTSVREVRTVIDRKKHKCRRPIRFLVIGFNADSETVAHIHLFGKAMCNLEEQMCRTAVYSIVLQGSFF